MPPWEILLAFLAGVLLAAAAGWWVWLRASMQPRRRLAAWESLAKLLNGGRVPREERLQLCRKALLEGRVRAALLDEMAEGLALLDRHRRVLLSNRTFRDMFRTQEGEQLGSGALSVSSRSEMESAIDAAANHDRTATADLRLGTTPPRDILVTLTPHEHPDGQHAVILTALDVTSRKRAEQVRTEFVANVSHELRTPLAAIRGYVETCLEPYPEGQEPPYRRFLSIVHHHTLRLTALIEDLLILSRIESKAATLQMEPIAIYPAVETAISTLQKEAEKKRTKVSNSLPPGLPRVHADRNALDRILLNLIENAIKYSDEGMPVEVSARLQPDSICVSVRDKGFGIPRSDQERIFERFYRVDKTRSRAAGGTGLGLSIVKHLVQAHGGEVWVDSEPGRGSTFYFTVPLANSDKRALQEESRPVDEEKPEGGGHSSEQKPE